MTEQWKHFEQLTQKIQQQLAPGAKVGFNETLVGKSGARNQLDVTLRSSIGQYKFFCIIECKDWNKKVDINTVRAFQSKVEDVHAMQGVMVSAQGFTREAHKYADAKNISLYRLVDAESENWREVVSIPIVIGQIYLKAAEVHTIDTRTNKPYSLSDAFGNPLGEREIYFFEPKQNRYIQIRDFLEERWDDIFKTREPQTDEWFETKGGEFFLYKGNEKHIPVIIKYRLEAETLWYYGRLSLQRCLGLIDQKTGELLTSDYQSNPLMFREIIKTWPSTRYKSEIPYPLNGIFFMGHFFRKHNHSAPEGVVIQKVPL